MKNWNRLSFKIKWDRSSPARFFIDLILLDLLIKPAIDKFRSEIFSWTFHRSAAPNDPDGHMLKFNVYTDVEIAQKILDFIKLHENYNLVKNYFEENELKIMDIGSNIEAIAGGVGASKEILKSWHYFMMGACDMYINLIEETKNKLAKTIDKNDQKQLESYYQDIQNDIASQWHEGGQHAFFHFLSEIFGYPPIKLVLIADSIQPCAIERGGGKFRGFFIPDVYI